MPRLPTMRVIGSQAISTRLRPSVAGWRRGLVTVAMRFLLSVCPGLIAGRQLRAAVPPLGFPVERVVGESPELPDHPAVHADEERGDRAPRRLVHEGHDLIGEAGHGAGDADAADVGTAADAVHPAALG